MIIRFRLFPYKPAFSGNRYPISGMHTLIYRDGETFTASVLTH